MENFGYFINKSVIFSLDLLDLRQILLDKPILRFKGPIKIRVWARKTHRILLDIFKNKGFFSVDLRQTLLDKPILRFNGPIKTRF